MKTSILLISALAAGIGAQDFKPVDAGGVQKPVVVDQEEWGEGFGHAKSYRSALALALEDAVAKAKGVGIARGPSIRSRLSVVSEHKGGDKTGFFDGSTERERDWVQQQISGFVRKYEVTNKGQDTNQNWEVTVRALVASLQGLESGLVIELIDNDLRSWQHERFEEEGPGRAFDRRKGRFEGPRIGDYLRRSGAVKIVGGDAGVEVVPQSERAEQEKQGRRLVASHRVTIDWQPVMVRSMVEKPNRARPTRGPRAEYIQGGSVKVAIKVEDLIEGVVMLDETFSVPDDKPGSYSADRLDAFITQLVDKAKAAVARKVFFTLRQPVVMRKWAGAGGQWFVEARISRRVAAGFKRFSIGNNGSLGDVDWQSLGSATFVGGSGVSCTFQLDGVGDLASIQAGVSEVRPIP